MAQIRLSFSRGVKSQFEPRTPPKTAGQVREEREVKMFSPRPSRHFDTWRQAATVNASFAVKK
jgi:hypothetical protein